MNSSKVSSLGSVSPGFPSNNFCIKSTIKKTHFEWGNHFSSYSSIYYRVYIHIYILYIYICTYVHIYIHIALACLMMFNCVSHPCSPPQVVRSNASAWPVRSTRRRISCCWTTPWVRWIPTWRGNWWRCSKVHCWPSPPSSFASSWMAGVREDLGWWKHVGSCLSPFREHGD